MVQVTILFFKTFCERLNVTNCSKRFENLLKLSNCYCLVKSQLIPIFFVCVCGGGGAGHRYTMWGHKRVQMSTIGAQWGRCRDNRGHKEWSTWTPESRRGYRWVQGGTQGARGVQGCKREYSSLFIIETNKSYKLNLRSHTGKGFTIFLISQYLIDLPLRAVSLISLVMACRVVMPMWTKL